ncbi:MAG: Crp/Fnr family transcriptional regulator [Mucilaginibacter sp.]|uniref:Crp/Fnr family transcriptional regulator n=1 Tax=Mucilaginibacter sp. TaxID=1882438 RepID=UPI0031A743C6
MPRILQNGMEEILRKQIEKIVALTDDEFQFVLSHFTARIFRKHQYVVQSGDAAPNDHFVVKGLLKSFYVDDSGKTHILQFAMEDWWISDPQAYHNRTTATLNIDCLEDTQILFISIDNREKLCADLKKMEYFFLKKTTAGYIALQKRILSLMSQNAEDRFAQFLQLYPTLLPRVPKALIASYLGISRETLSRVSAA